MFPNNPMLPPQRPFHRYATPSEPRGPNSRTSRGRSGTPFSSVSINRPQSTVSQRSSSLFVRSRPAAGRNRSVATPSRPPRTPARSVASSSYSLSRRTSASTTSGRKSRATSSIWGTVDHEVFCAVNEGRGVTPTIGLAFVNVTTNEVVLSQICDTQFCVKTVHKIRMYDPSVILFVNTAFPPNNKSNLLSILQEEVEDANIMPLDRKYWNEGQGLELIQELVFRDDLEAIQVAIQGNFYATCCFAAAIQYMQSSCQLTIMSHSLRLRYEPAEDTMMIDISTIQSLELIQNLHNTRSKDCLIGVLNQTLTPMGYRMMRSNILQPSTQMDATLMPRYDALDELTVKEDMFFEVRKTVGPFTDAERLLSKLAIVSESSSIYDMEQAINNVLLIKSFLRAVPPIYEALGNARAELLVKIRDACRPELIQPVVELTDEVMNEDSAYAKSPLELRNQRVYTVKSNMCGMLDVARQKYKESTEDIGQHWDQLKEEHGLEIDLRYEAKRAYYFKIKECDLEGRDMPDVLINRICKNGAVECTTLELVKLNNRIRDSTSEAVMLSDGIIRNLLDAIRGHIATLFRVCEGVALLDMLAAFGYATTSRNYVRPQLGDTLALQAARHPIIEMIPRKTFVPNDVYAQEQHRFQIVTGCNMSGKSTYIRMIALLQVMAQIGCFVPAESASFPVIHQLFVRLSTDDSTDANMSTFSVEMREMSFILRNVDRKSLVVVDELGRGTSTRDGLAIALAMSEALIQSNGLVWFVTHFHELAKILGSRLGVLNLHLQTQISQASDSDALCMTMLYKISNGPLEETQYGLNLARVIGFPERFLQVAEGVSLALKKQIEQRKQDSQARKVALRRKLIMNLYEMLQNLRNSDLDDEALGSYMRRLQDEFVDRMDALSRGDEGRGEEVEVEVERDGVVVEEEEEEEDDDDEVDGVQMV